MARRDKSIHYSEHSLRKRALKRRKMQKSQRPLKRARQPFLDLTYVRARPTHLCPTHSQGILIATGFFFIKYSVTVDLIIVIVLRVIVVVISLRPVLPIAYIT